MYTRGRFMSSMAKTIAALSSNQPPIKINKFYRGATKPMHHNYQAHALELVLCSNRSHRNEKPKHRSEE